MWVCVRRITCHVPLFYVRGMGTYLYVCICIYVCVTHITTSSSLWLRQVSFMMLLVTKNTKATKNEKVEQCCSSLENRDHGV